MYEDSHLPFKNKNEYFAVIEKYCFLQLEQLETIFFQKKADFFQNELQITQFPVPKQLIENFESFQFYYASKVKNTIQQKKFLPLQSLIQNYHLSKFQVHCIMTAFVCESNPDFLNRLKKLGVIKNKTLTVYTCIQLYRTYSSLSIDSTLWKYLEFLFSFLFQNQKSIHLDTPIFFREYVLCFLLDSPISLPCYLSFEKKSFSVVSSLEKDFLKLTKQVSPDTIFLFFGKTGIGKTSLLQQIAIANQKELLFADSQILQAMTQEELIFVFDNIKSICLLKNCWLCFTDIDCGVAEKITFLIKDLLQYKIKLFVTAQSEYIENSSDYFSIFPISAASHMATNKLDIWKENLKEKNLENNISVCELASKFDFTPSQIAKATQEAEILSIDKISSKQLHDCCYNQSTAKLSQNTQKIKAVFTWDDLILSDELKQQIQQSCNHIKLKEVIYHQWNFSSRITYGKGVTILFAGPSGTGKTMAAQVIANELSMELYKIDSASVVSKYIGETEKNLNQVFEEAKNSNIILFFDEMDALFGKRSETQDSHDKYANMETAFLLQKIEEYEGIVLMATNFIANIDEAFMRRIDFIFHIPFPSKEQRLQLWKNSFPKNAPLEKTIDWEFLSEKFELSGAVIKNISVSAAFLAAGEKKEISMKHILHAAKLELSKQGKLLLKEDFGIYSYLLEESFYDNIG